MQQSILSFGEILYDIFPSYRRLGGAPFNFAYHMYAFGFPATLISRVGEDADGREILDFLKNRLDAGAIQHDSGHKTGRVLVEVDAKGVPDFDIVEDAAYDFIEYDSAVEAATNGGPALIYFGTLAQRNAVSRSTLEKVLSQNKGATGLYDMNLRQNYFSVEILERSLTACNLVKLNNDELQICKSLFRKQGSDESFVDFLMERYDVGWVCLTKGAQGSELFHSSGRFTADNVPKQSVVDTVGAGDAYTAVLALGVLSGWSPETILDRATEFAGAVCALQGAIPDEAAFYDPYLPWITEGGNGY